MLQQDQFTQYWLVYLLPILVTIIDSSLFPCFFFCLFVNVFCILRDICKKWCTSRLVPQLMNIGFINSPGITWPSTLKLVTKGPLAN